MQMDFEFIVFPNFFYIMLSSKKLFCIEILFLSNCAGCLAVTKRLVLICFYCQMLYMMLTSVEIHFSVKFMRDVNLCRNSLFSWFEWSIGDCGGLIL